MSQFEWYQPLDGFGMLAVDLHECRWFHVQSYDLSDGADYGLSYYLTRDGRWIELKEDEDMVGEKDGHPVFGVTQSYREVASVAAQNRRQGLLRIGVELVTLAKAETAVPAQKGVVVAWGTKPFGLFEEVHRPTNPPVSNLCAAWPAL
jgi:hypothetical protein